MMGSNEEQAEPKGEFGEVISEYSQAQALADGFLTDFGRMIALNFHVVMTCGILDHLNKVSLVQAVINATNILSMMPSVDMVIFKADIKKPYVEDGGRTAILGLEGLVTKIYVKKDGETLTFMEADEY
jgi:hypothetical protein